MGEMGEGFTRTTIKDTCTKTMGGAKTGEGGEDDWGSGEGQGKGRKLSLNNNKIQKYLIKKT